MGQEVDFKSRAIEAWARTTSELTRLPLSVEIDPFPESPREILELRGRWIYRHLALQKLAFDPVTLEQIAAKTSLRRNI